MLKVLDLFSGIGGFSLGLESTKGFKTIGFVEKDQFCQKVLKKNFKNIPIIGDIRDVKGSEFKADVITGGFPCQSISIAGKQKGKDDDRFLFPEMLRVIKEVKPRWIIGENVQNLINISNGTILREIIEGLETEGFEVQCFSISASSQGAWHKRERIWIIANSDNRLSIGKNQEIQTRGNTINDGSSSNVSNTKSKWSRECREFNKEEGLEKSKSTQFDCICSDVPNTQCNEHKHTPTRQSGTGELWGFYSEKKKQTSHDLWSKTSRCDASLGKQKNLSDSKCKGLERLSQQSSTIGEQNKRIQSRNENSRGEKRQQTWWQTQSELCGVPNGISYELDKDRANRVKALGNSIVPQIARELGLAILDAEQN